MRYLLFALIAATAFAQEDPEKLVTVPQRYVSAEGLSHKAAPDEEKWIGIGKEIGEATKEGLGAVVDQAERFGTTKVGTFVMFMVAWKIVGHDILAIGLGVPIWIAGVGLWVWSMKRCFFGRKVLTKEDKTNKIKEYKTEAVKFESGDSRAAAAVFHGLFLAGWCLVWILVIFS